VRDRDRRSIREFIDEEAMLYAAEQEAKERPIREAEKQLNETHRKLHALQKEQVATQADDEVFVDPLTIGYTIPQVEADKYNAEQARLFVKNHPEYYASEHNIAAFVGYLGRNQIQIVSALTFEKAAARLAEFHLLEGRPAPVEPVLEEEQLPVVVEERTAEKQPETFTGVDPATGRERAYTAREVDAMDSVTYRRAFKITKADLALPTRNW
jgi:hypothetical protein